MNWKLILKLSLFAAAMSVATVTVLPGKIEPIFWLPIFLFCAWRIAKVQNEKVFMHGFALGLANCFWVTTTHFIWTKNYLALNPSMQKYYDAPMIANHPRISQVLFGLMIGVISGIIIGLFSLLAKRMVKK